MNKKHIYIASLITIGVLALGSMSHAYALFTMPANDASFNISQAKTYYLKGNFNDWSASPEYILNDVTATMGEEEHKVAEYTITKSLEIDKHLKIWDSEDNWYTQGVDNCSYVDKWGRTTDNNADYVVPMTANYTIYLKFYDSGASQIYVTAPDLTKLYFKPNTNWNTDGARFAAYFFNNETSTSTWSDLTLNGDYYEVDIPTNYPGVIFCRMDPGTTENIWGNKWNQTADLNCGPASYQAVYELAEDAPWDNAGDTYWRAI